MPQSQLFDVDGINPPRRISKLSSRYRRSIAALKKDNNMPPRRPPIGRALVNQNHPAATAAAAAKIDGGILSAPTSRESPSRAAKTLANENMMIQLPLTNRFRTVGGSRTNCASMFCRSLSTRTIRISRRSLQSNPPDQRIRC